MRKSRREVQSVIDDKKKKVSASSTFRCKFWTLIGEQGESVCETLAAALGRTCSDVPEGRS